MAAITQGSPRPRNTFTELDPVMFPIAESAVSEFLAAVILANVSGREVPRATRVIAVIESSMFNSHPSKVANYSTIAVQRPMKMRATKNAAFPFQYDGGGTKANATFQVIEIKCTIASPKVTSLIIKSSSSIYGPSITAFLNCPDQVSSF